MHPTESLKLFLSGYFVFRFCFKFIWICWNWLKMFLLWRHKFLEKTLRFGSGCGYVGRAVVSSTRGSAVWIQSSVKLMLNVCLISTVLKWQSKKFTHISCKAYSSKNGLSLELGNPKRLSLKLKIWQAGKDLKINFEIQLKLKKGFSCFFV